MKSSGGLGLLRVMILSATLCGCSLAAVAQVYGPPDRTSITEIMFTSGMQIQDRNNDQAVSDVDVALDVLDRLVETYGEGLAVGDLDRNGVENGEDVVEAIARIVRGAFGKTATDAQPIGEQDLEATLLLVVDQAAEGDLNFDGASDGGDLAVTVAGIGTDPEQFNVIDTAARELFVYIGAILTNGRESFMATMAAPNTHLQGVSNTWPPSHPSWWPPNHTTGVSQSYEPPPRSPYHSDYDTRNNPGPPPHQSDVSRRWPANHLKQASETWLPPPSHGFIASLQGETPPPSHDYSITRTWPPSHMHAASVTWPATHDQTISRTWWPQHTQADSSTRTWPPMHAGTFSDLWRHSTQLSQATWPPNHYPSVSDGWGPGHTINISAAYPPGHLSYASNTWPGPQPLWPPGHTEQLSRQWGDPTPNPWPPLFPPGHDWFTTFKELYPIIPRIPWPVVGG